MVFVQTPRTCKEKWFSTISCALDWSCGFPSLNCMGFAYHCDLHGLGCLTQVLWMPRLEAVGGVHGFDDVETYLRCMCVCVWRWGGGGGGGGSRREEKRGKSSGSAPLWLMYLQGLWLVNLNQLIYGSDVGKTSVPQNSTALHNQSIIIDQPSLPSLT